MQYDILCGDCLEQLKTLPDNSFDGCLTDPPYALEFMGKSWDKCLPPVELWQEVLRVMKPGAYLLSFGGTRTFHRLTCNIEDAGFQIRDCLQWLYGQGFPKSLNISKAIDKRLGAEREVVGKEKNWGASKHDEGKAAYGDYAGKWEITNPASDEAQQWGGYGTCLKPAWEPIMLCQKPIDGTFAENCMKWGCGGLNINGCRIEPTQEGDYEHTGNPSQKQSGNVYGWADCPGKFTQCPPNAKGRYPANLLLDDESAEILDKQSGELKSGNLKAGHKRGSGTTSYDGGGGTIRRDYGGDSGGASRFFYCAKASTRERDKGLTQPVKVQTRPAEALLSWNETPRRNCHPTVKPLALCRYLATLILPPARETPRRLLVPFSGSGSEMIGAIEAGWDWITGIEREAEYVAIARGRIDAS